MKTETLHALRSGRLLLRKPRLSDWKVISHLRSDRDLNQFVQRPNADTREKAVNFIKSTNLKIENNDLLYWAISLSDTEEMIGSICLWNFSEDRKTAEVGYDLKAEFHKKGIMDEALKMVLNYGIKELGIRMIEAFTQRDNIASVRLLERNSFSLNEKRKDPENDKNLIYEKKTEDFPC